jgi:hypothetical protein
MRCDSCYGLTDAAQNFIIQNGYKLRNDETFDVEYFDEEGTSYIYTFEPIEKYFYDNEPEYFSQYINDKNEVIRQYSQVLFFSSGACEFLALEKFDFEKEEWVVVEESLWKESDVPVGNYSPSMNYETGLFCRA